MNDDEFKSFALTDKYVVRASVGTCVSKILVIFDEEYSGILVTIVDASDMTLLQSFCIDPRDFNGTHDS